MRTLNRCTLLALAAGFAAARPIHAQDTLRVPQNAQNPQARTHTVVRGDNLWDLSQTYLGNAFLWPEIYRLNRDVVEDPHWIYPGEILRLPGGDSTSVAVAVTPNVNVPALPTESQSTTTTMMLPVDPGSATVFTRTPAAAPAAPAQVSGGPTTGTAVVNALPAPPTVRWGEVIAAPYVDREGGPRAFGRIHKSADLTGVAETTDRFRFQSFDKIYLSPPVGYVAPEGERYLAVRMGPVLRDQGQIVIPTGVVEVTQAARTGAAATGKVVRNYAGVAATDRLIPIDTAGVGSNIRPVRVNGGPTTKIAWVWAEPVLPSIGAYVILDVTSRNGVRMGDEFTIYKPATRDRDNLPIDPEILIAKVQVVRATPYGVTAVVIGQAQPAIKNGSTARLTAKMP
jgi:LysM repeat protein